MENCKKYRNYVSSEVEGSNQVGSTKVDCNIPILEKTNIPAKPNRLNVNGLGSNLSGELISKYKQSLIEGHKKVNNKPDSSTAKLIDSQKNRNNEAEPSIGADSALDCPRDGNTGSLYSDNICFIDWLTATNSDDRLFKRFCFELTNLLKKANIRAVLTDKGFRGYKSKSDLVITSGNESVLLGNLATGNVREGGLFELNGKGCTLLRMSYPDLIPAIYSLFVDYEFRFSRLDTALDFQADYAIEKGYTVPKIMQAGVIAGLFDRDTQKSGKSLASNTIGQWGELMARGVDTASYDPLIHAQAGLTAYFGNRKSSPDFFRIYEKGKEQNGNLPEGDIERAYFRIEHEMKRPDGKTTIPLDAMIRPDAYFANGRSGVRSLLDDMRKHYKLDKVSELQRDHQKKLKVKRLSKKIEWLKVTGGRVLKTLQDQGASDSEIVAWLTRPEGLQEFINDLNPSDGLSVLDEIILSGIVPRVSKPKNDRVTLDVSKAESGQWIAQRLRC